MDPKKMKSVYTVIERNGKSYWLKLGIGFVNSDGSINVKLESLPVAGDFQIRDYVPREENAGTTLRGRNGQSDDEAFAGARGGGCRSGAGLGLGLGLGQRFRAAA